MADLEVFVHSGDVEQTFARVVAFLSPLGMVPFMETVMGPHLAERAKERFASEGDDAVGQWAPLRSATVAIRQSEGFGGSHPINRRTGELENWVTKSGWNAIPAGSDTVLSFPGRTPTGELLQKVETAQRGRSKPRTVARPVLGVSMVDLGFLQTSLMMAVAAAAK